jgi:hypothetical protein
MTLQTIAEGGGVKCPPHLPKNFLTFEKISLDALVAHPQPLIRGQIVSRIIKIHDSWILLDGRENNQLTN